MKALTGSTAWRGEPPGWSWRALLCAASSACSAWLPGFRVAGVPDLDQVATLESFG